jgi:hypothetical protein
VTVFIAIGLLVAIVALVGVMVWVFRSASEAAQRSPETSTPRPRPVPVDFHVRGEEAAVYFSVPLGPGDVDDVLRDLLLHESIEVYRGKRGHGLPLEGVTQVVAYGRRGDDYVAVGSVDLPAGGQLPELAAPDLVPHTALAGYDPLAHLGEQEFDIEPSVATPDEESELGPISADVKLTRSTESGLRAQGVDPDDMGLEDLTLGLLRMSGYRLSVERTGFQTDDGSKVDIYIADRAGDRTLLGILPHRPGEYPEVSERAINQFVVSVAEVGPRRAFLVTDKFGPYMMYEKERRDARVRFVTRERIQTFVDGFALQ